MRRIGDAAGRFAERSLITCLPLVGCLRNAIPTIPSPHACDIAGIRSFANLSQRWGALLLQTGRLRCAKPSPPSQP